MSEHKTILKVLLVNFIFCASNSLEFQEVESESELVSLLHQFNEKFFAMKSSNVRLIFSENDEVLSEVIKFSKASLTFELFEISKLVNISLSPSTCNIIQIKSETDFHLILKQVSLKKFYKRGYFLFVIENCSSIDSDKLFGAAWQRYIYNVNVLCNENSTLLMKTFMPFQRDSCGNTTSLVINPLLDLFPVKLENLFRCPIRIATFFYPPITMREDLGNGSMRYFGSEMDMLFGLADGLNFSIDMAYINQSGFTGLLLENGTSTGILKQTIEGEKDMLMGFYYLTYLRTQYLSFTQSHYSIPLIIVIPYGQLLTPFEKLFQPFQPVVWFCLFLSFSTGILVIAIVNCQSETVKKFIFGEGVRNPYMAMLEVIFGGSQHLVPKRNFARNLLLMFMLFCLVQRSVYQGSLYIFLQSDGRHPEVSSVDEMVEKGFVFYIRETLEHNIRHMNFYNRRKTVKFADYPELQLRTLNPSFKGGIIEPLLEAVFLNQKNYKNYTLNVLKEYLLDVQIVYYFPKNFYLVEPLNDQIGILKSAGLIKLWMERYIDTGYIKMKKLKTSARILQLHQLLGGFQVMSIGFVLGTLAFLLEKLSMSKKLKCLRKAFKSESAKEKLFFVK